MRLRCFAILAVLFSCGFSALLAFESQFKQYSGDEDKPAPLPRDAYERMDRTVVRLDFPIFPALYDLNQAYPLAIDYVVYSVTD